MCGGRDTHGGTVVLSVSLGAVPTQEQAPQIGRLAADNSEQFRVRAALAGNPPMAELGPESGQRYSLDGFLQLWARRGKRQN